MKTRLHPLLVFVFLALANALAAQRTIDQIQKAMTVEQNMIQYHQGYQSRDQSELTQIDRSISHGQGVALGAKVPENNDPSLPGKMARYKALQTSMADREATIARHQANLLSLQRQLDEANARAQSAAAAANRHNKPTGRSLADDLSHPIPDRDDAPTLPAGYYPVPGSTPSPGSRPNPTTTPPKPKPTPWTFDTPSAPGPSGPSLLQPTPLGGSEPNPSGNGLKFGGDDGNFAKDPAGGMDDPGLGLRTLDWRNPSTGVREKVFIDPSGNVYSAAGTPLDERDAETINVLAAAADAASNSSARNRAAENDEGRFYRDMVKDWEKRFEQGKATWADHPTRIDVPAGLPGGGNMLTMQGMAARNYMDAVIKPRAERTVRDIQSPDLLAQGIVRTNFGSNMEDYVNIRVKSGKVWDENFYADTLPRVEISDAEVAARTELIRKTKGELAYRNELAPTKEEEGMKHAFDRARVHFVSKNPGYYTKGSKESAHAQEFMNRELPPNPLQLARPLGTNPGIQSDTPAAPVPSPNGTPAGPTPSKVGPKNS